MLLSMIYTTFAAWINVFALQVHCGICMLAYQYARSRASMDLRLSNYVHFDATHL